MQSQFFLLSCWCWDDSVRVKKRVRVGWEVTLVVCWEVGGSLGLFRSGSGPMRWKWWRMVLGVVLETTTVVGDRFRFLRWLGIGAVCGADEACAIDDGGAGETDRGFFFFEFEGWRSSFRGVVTTVFGVLVFIGLGITCGLWLVRGKSSVVWSDASYQST